MFVKNEIDFDELKNLCWSDAINTLEKIEENEKETELMDYLENEIFFNEIPTETEVNDFLRFESDEIFERLEIKED